MEKINKLIGNIPTLIYTPKILTHDKTIIFYYGYSSSQNNHFFLANILTNMGFQVIIPELPNHGFRLSSSYNKESDYLDMWRTILLTIEETPQFLKYLVNDKSLNIKKLNLLGYSMGGFISSSIFADNDNIDTLISLNGCSAWKETINLKTKLNVKFKIPPDMLEKIDRLDPFNKIDTMFPRRMMFINGKSDARVPIFPQRSFAEKAKTLYKDAPSNLSIEEVNELGHFFTLKMLEKSCCWINQSTN